MTTIIPIPAFRDNYIWAVCAGDAVAVVDPGDAAPVLAWLARTGVRLCAVIATHHHMDHVGGIDALCKHVEVPVYGPANESIPGRTHALGEGDRIVVPDIDLELSVLDIPGHTAGHIAYYTTGAAPLLFCGDTLFAAGCGRLFEGTPVQMWASLSKLAALAPDTRVYCGHEYTLANLRFAEAVEPGNRDVRARTAREQAKRDRLEPTLPSTIGEEHATNPFLRAALPSVAECAAAHAGRRMNDAVDAFATLREWKNGFA
ncbi:MAG TPA: hydroxyacylglutathione hydrolase [Casimicrobiaceae bacterium]|nr:hydroxyacylglutathione hydrolase [Casimicrobiaceae bacterium]